MKLFLNGFLYFVKEGQVTTFIVSNLLQIVGFTNAPPTLKYGNRAIIDLMGHQEPLPCPFVNQ